MDDPVSAETSNRERGSEVGGVVVVGLRLASFVGRPMPERVRELEKAAVERAGVLVASGWNFVAFAFGTEDVRRIVAFVEGARRAAAPSELRWAIGIGMGALELLADDGAHGELAWGRALVVAGLLSEAAEPGEVLCTESVAMLVPPPHVVAEGRVARSSGESVTGMRIEPSDVVDAPVARDTSERPSASRLSERRMPSSPHATLEQSSPVGRAGEIFASLLTNPNGVERSAFTERMRVLSLLGRGDIDDALRVLRRARADLDPKDHAQRCQASLAIGVALSVAGRPQEALLEGMDALARARHAGDDRGANACLAFLAKLFGSVGRTEFARP